MAKYFPECEYWRLKQTDMASDTYTWLRRGEQVTLESVLDHDPYGN